MIETLEKTGILNTVKMSYEFTPLPKGYDLRWESGPKVNSLENIHYMPAGGNKVLDSTGEIAVEKRSKNRIP